MKCILRFVCHWNAYAYMQLPGQANPTVELIKYTMEQRTSVQTKSETATFVCVCVVASLFHSNFDERQQNIVKRMGAFSSVNIFTIIRRECGEEKNYVWLMKYSSWTENWWHFVVIIHFNWMQYAQNIMLFVVVGPYIMGLYLKLNGFELRTHHF